MDSALSPAQQGLTLLRLSRLHRQRFQERQPWPHLPTAAELAQPSPALLRACVAYVMSGKFSEDRQSIHRDTVLVATDSCPTGLPGEVLARLPCAENVSRVEVHYAGNSLFGSVTVPSSSIPRLEPLLTDPEIARDVRGEALNEFLVECAQRPEMFPGVIECPGGRVQLAYFPDIMEDNLAHQEIQRMETGFLLDAHTLAEVRLLASDSPIAPALVAQGEAMLHDAGRTPLDDEKESLVSAILGALICEDPLLPRTVQLEARRRLSQMATKGFFAGVPNHLPLSNEDWGDDVVHLTYAKVLPSVPDLPDLEERVEVVENMLLEIAQGCLPQIRERLKRNLEDWRREMKEIHGHDF